MGCGASAKPAPSSEQVSPSAPANAQHVQAATSDLPPKLSVVGDGDAFRGLSVNFISEQLLELLNLTDESPEKVYNVEPQIRELSASPLLCPRDGRPGCALVDVAPDEFAGRATHMISYGWGYRVADIASSLAGYCEGKKLCPTKVTVWICFACINQHRVKESRAKGINIPFEEFESTFRERVIGIGKVLCLLSPWQDPLYIQRVWCVFELYTATTTPDVEITLILPPRELKDFVGTLATKEGLDKVWNCFSNVAVENAKSSVESDRCTILKLVEGGPGTKYVNDQVTKNLRSWCADMAVSSLQSQIKNTEVNNSTQAIAAAAVNAVKYWHLQGATIWEATAFAENVLEYCKATTGISSPEYALAASSVAWVAMLASQFDKAISMYEQILKIEQQTNGMSAEYGARMFDLGWAFCSKGDHQKAIQVLGEAKVIQAQVIGTANLAYGRTVRDMGEAMIELEQFDGASEAYDEAVGILESAVGRHHPDTCIALKHQARVFVAKEDPLTAIKQLEEVLLQEENTIGSESSDHTITLLILSDALRAMGKFARALYINDKCLSLFAANLGRETKFGLWTMRIRVCILREMDLDDRAEVALKEALSIAETIAGKESARYLRLHEELEQLRADQHMGPTKSDSKNHLSPEMPMMGQVKSISNSAVPWGEADGDEASLLSKFKELDATHSGLIEFAEVLKLAKTLLKRNLEEHEVQALADAAYISKDLTHRRRLHFRAFQNLGKCRADDIDHIHTAFDQYFKQLEAESSKG